MPIRAAFVMEQTLGHITHAQNLRAAEARQHDVEITWIPISFGLSRVGRLVPGYNSNWSLRASVQARTTLWREHARRPFDALLFHTQVTALFSTDLMRRVPAVISLDATPMNFDSVGAAYGHRAARGGWLDSRKYDLNKRAFGAASAIVAWSDWSAASLTRDYGVSSSKIHVLAPGAEAAYFAIGAKRQHRRPSGDVLRLLFVGGDFARKGGLALLHAVRDARTQRPFELHVVTRDAVPATSRVIVHHGVRSNSEELLRLIADADIFILPSRGECLSIALMEAAAAALPIITTGVGALGEVAVDGRSALIVAPDDVAALRLAIERLVDDDAMRTRLGRVGHELAREKFDAEKNNAEILHLAGSLARRASMTGVA